MITREFRPTSFEEVAGQDLNKKVLKAIINNPENSPKTLIFQGAWGSGKTTMARIFVRAVNCKAANKPCMKCATCTDNLEASPYYLEYDSAVVGSVDKIRELRDTFFYSISTGYKVIVFDEAQSASKQAQSALLKVLEESPSRVFFIFCTTDVDKILPTIRSRSLELRFECVKENAVVDNLKKVLSKLDKTVSDDILLTIARKSRGHMRNAHMMLDQFLMVGEADFREVVKSSQDYFVDYLLGIAQHNQDRVFKSIDMLLTFPLAELSIDYQEVISALAQTMVGYKIDERLEPISKLMGADTLKLVKLAISDWVIQSFDSDMTLQAALLCMYQMLSQATSAKVATPNAINRAARR